MEKLETKDHLNIEASKSYRSVIPQEETLVWSGEVIKINKKGRRQVRDFVITDAKIYNLGKRGNFIKNLFSKSIKRSFKVEEVKAVTYSGSSSNFVLHVPSEYDYNLSTGQKDEFLKYLLFVQQKKGSEPLQVYTVEDVDLFNFNRYEGQKESKIPKNVAPQPHSLQTFESVVNIQIKELEEKIRQTEVIISKDGAPVHEGSFDVLTALGKGRYARVLLVQKRDTRQLFAMKVINKIDVIKRNSFERLKSERLIMQQANSHFVQNLTYCFASPTHVFFVMPFKQGGELYFHLRKARRLPESIVRFYAAQIVQGLIHLHSHSIVYRDLKPENILLDEKGNACLTDFGISKVLEESESTKSFIGTPEYVAPEILLQKGHGKAVDLWCLGVLLFELVFGRPPFFDKSQSIMLNAIAKLEPVFPTSTAISEELQSLILSVF